MFVYIIECVDGSLYTGIASKIKKRLNEHKNQLKPCAKYTKSHQMTKLIALWQTREKTDACKLEYWLKTLSHLEKLQLIQNDNLSFFLGEKIQIEKFNRASEIEIKNINNSLNN